MVEKKSGLEKPSKRLRAARAPEVGTDVETSSMGGENAPHSDYQQAGRNYNVYELWKPKPSDFHAAALQHSL